VELVKHYKIAPYHPLLTEETMFACHVKPIANNALLFQEDVLKQLILQF